MSRSKATKRRKVWLQITTGADEGFVEEHRFRASLSKEKGYDPFIERLPGDVVLSREEVAVLARALVMAGGHTYPGSDAAKAVVAAVDLLRGRR